MVKLGKNKLKTLNKLVRKKNAPTTNSSNKVLKKKLNAEKRVTFQKEVLLNAVYSDQLVKKVSNTEVLLNKLLKSSDKEKPKKSENEPNKINNKKKLKPVEKQKNRQKIHVNDTKLLLSLMKKKRS